MKDKRNSDENSAGQRGSSSRRGSSWARRAQRMRVAKKGRTDNTLCDNSSRSNEIRRGSKESRMPATGSTTSRPEERSRGRSWSRCMASKRATDKVAHNSRHFVERPKWHRWRSRPRRLRQVMARPTSYLFAACETDSKLWFYLPRYLP